jgi:phosphate transport system protein
MPRTLELEIEAIKKKILSFSAVVEENVRDAIKALVYRDAALAAKVIDTDEEIDTMEVVVEEDCLKTLALYQPVAKDLRFIIAVFNINNDLERIGDLAVNIAERAMSLAACSQVDIPFDYTAMAEKVLAMVKKSLDSLVRLDPDLAQQVCDQDEEIDYINRQVYARVQDRIRQYPERVDCLIQFPAISSELERIADHATNIAEEVIYLAKGEIVRHRAKNEKPQLRVIKPQTGEPSG